MASNESSNQSSATERITPDIFQWTEESTSSKKLIIKEIPFPGWIVRLYVRNITLHTPITTSMFIRRIDVKFENLHDILVRHTGGPHVQYVPRATKFFGVFSAVRLEIINQRVLDLVLDSRREMTMIEVRFGISDFEKLDLGRFMMVAGRSSAVQGPEEKETEDSGRRVLRPRKVEEQAAKAKKGLRLLEVIKSIRRALGNRDKNADWEYQTLQHIIEMYPLILTLEKFRPEDNPLLRSLIGSPVKGINSPGHSPPRNSIGQPLFQIRHFNPRRLLYEP